MVDNVEGSGKASCLSGAGLEDSLVEAVQVDQESFDEVIEWVIEYGSPGGL